MKKAITIMLMVAAATVGFGQNPPPSHSAVLTWTAPAAGNDPAVGYNVYRAVKGSTTFTKLNASPVTATTYTDAAISSGVDYLYYVAAVDANGVQGDPSNVWDSGAVPGPLAPSALTGTVTNGQ